MPPDFAYTLTTSSHLSVVLPRLQTPQSHPIQPLPKKDSHICIVGYLQDGFRSIRDRRD